MTARTTRAPHRTRAALTAVMLLTPAALVGCGSSPQDRCSLTPRLARTSETRGGSLDVSITRSSCWADLSEHQRDAGLVVTLPGSTTGDGVFRVTFASDGTFHHRIPIPSSTLAGKGSVTTSKPCGDGETSCAGEPEAAFDVR